MAIVVDNEKLSADNIVHEERASDVVLDGSILHQSALGGHLATDKYGNPIVAFDQAAERKLRLKIDLYILPTVAMLYLFCFIDRANIGNARLAHLEDDLGLQGYDYNTVLSTFYISYIVMEIPATMLCKWIGPGWFIPATTLGFGLCSVFTGLCRNMQSICGVRFLLGVFEAGMLPGIAYYLSRWYRRSELTLRISLYTVMASLAGAFGGLLASAILSLDHFGGLRSWRMIFAIEGIVTCGLALISFFTLTDQILDKIDKQKILKGILSPVTLATSFVFLLDNITVQGLAFFAPTIVKTIYPDASTISQQLHTVPPYVIGAFFTVFFPALSTYFDRRNIFYIQSASLTIAGYIMFLATTAHDSQIRYGATFLVAAGAFSYAALCNSQVSANVVSDTARSAAIGTNVMMGNVGGLISTWSFLSSDAPNYRIGNGLNLAATCTIFLAAIALEVWMKADNASRERKDVDAELQGKSMKDIQDLDWKHPAFRWKP